MNVLEKYAANCGVKIREPFVATSYFPLKGAPYIILDNRSKFSSNRYDLFEDVMPYIEPVLKKEGIDICIEQLNALKTIPGVSGAHIIASEKLTNISTTIKNANI